MADRLSVSKLSPQAAAVVPAYIAAIAGAEVLGVVFGSTAWLLSQATLLVILLVHYALDNDGPYQQILPVLGLISLMRVLSLALPLKQLPLIYWYALIGIPLSAAIALTIRLLDLSPLRLGFRLWSWRPQAITAASGIPLGVVAFLLLQPNSAQPISNWYTILIGSASLLLFTGFAEELLFRGMLQRVCTEVFGLPGILYSSIVFAAMHLSSLSLGACLFYFLLGLFLGWCVYATGSLWGVVLARGLINVGVVFVWPFAGTRLGAPVVERLISLVELGLWLLIAFGLGAVSLALLARLRQTIQHE